MAADDKHRARDGLGHWRDADRAAGFQRHGLREWSRSSALARRAPERRRSRGGEQRAGASERWIQSARRRGVVADAQSRCRYGQPRPHHPAPPCGRRERGQDGLPDGPAFPVRHDAGRRHPVCRGYRCAARVPLCAGCDVDPGGAPQNRGTPCRSDRPSLDEGRHRQRRREDALCDRRLQLESRREWDGRGVRPRRRSRHRSKCRHDARLCRRASQPERLGLAAAERCAVGDGQRAR